MKSVYILNQVLHHGLDIHLRTHFFLLASCGDWWGSKTKNSASSGNRALCSVYVPVSQEHSTCRRWTQRQRVDFWRRRTPWTCERKSPLCCISGELFLSCFLRGSPMINCWGGTTFHKLMILRKFRHILTLTSKTFTPICVSFYEKKKRSMRFIVSNSE